MNLSMSNYVTIKLSLTKENLVSPKYRKDIRKYLYMLSFQLNMMADSKLVSLQMDILLTPPYIAYTQE